MLGAFDDDCAFTVGGFQLDQLSFMRKIRLWCLREWNCLRNIIIGRARLAIVVRPAVHRRNCSDPVSVTRQTRCRPLKGVGEPWVSGCQSSAENAVEEIEDEN